MKNTKWQYGHLYINHYRINISAYINPKRSTLYNFKAPENKIKSSLYIISPNTNIYIDSHHKIAAFDEEFNDNQEIIFSLEYSEQTDSFHILTDLQIKQSTIQQINICEHSSPWLVVQNEMLNSGVVAYRKVLLREGDVFKLGSLIFLVKEINYGNIKEDLFFPEGLKNVSVSNVNASLLNGVNICKICLCPETNKTEDPLLTPCKCKGTNDFIHYKCLLKWIYLQNQKMLSENTRSDNNEYQVSFFQRIKCEICKEVLPDSMKAYGKVFDLAHVFSRFKKYITVQYINVELGEIKKFCTLSFDKKNTFICGKKNDELVFEGNVSNEHCEISMEDNKCYIKDMFSQYGTLVLMQSKKIKLKKNNKLPLLIGGNLFKFELFERRTTSTLVCGCSARRERSVENVNEYQKENHLKSIEFVYDEIKEQT